VVQLPTGVAELGRGRGPTELLGHDLQHGNTGSRHA